jgi:hypothetical protein
MNKGYTGLDWVTIKKETPLAFSDLITYAKTMRDLVNPTTAIEGNSLIVYNHRTSFIVMPRDLYDFFDNAGIGIFIEPSENYPSCKCYIKTKKNKQDVGVFKSRIDAEHEGFKKAFSVLENYIEFLNSKKIKP